MKNLIAALLASILIISCNEKETLDVSSVTEYYPLQTGKVFIYRLDSTVVTNNNTSLAVRSYVTKDSVESQIIDGSGRKSFRIFRYLTDTSQSTPWRYIATYFATIDSGKVEYVENNLRFITLVNPVSNNTSWNGTKYISANDYSYLSNWNFQYQNCNESYTVKKGTIPNTVTILQIDETDPDRPFDANLFQQRKFSKEVYAKNVGLIYKEFLFWSWQPLSSTLDKGYLPISYGIKLNLIDYR